MTAVALCAGRLDLDWFSDDEGEQQACKQVCARCGHRQACLARTLALGDPWGVYGGLSGPERVWLAMATDDTPPARGDVHGKRKTYTAGCRCLGCCRANTEYVAQYRATERPAPVTRDETLDQQKQMHLFERNAG